MSHHSSWRGHHCAPGDINCTAGFKESLGSRSYKLLHVPFHGPTHCHHHEPPHPFPTVDVPDHAHYIIGSVILIVGITGVSGNALVVYVFCRSRTLHTAGNMFVVNLAVADFFMSLTQSPVFFAASLHRRWVFGERSCELYAFCGALFGICSMMTLTAIAADRCLAITQPLALVGRVSRHKAGAVLAVVWLYSLGWSLPPFFGWSAYVPEGLQTSCSWDYMTFTPSVRAYTILLFIFVFFIPLGIMASCYFGIFQAIRAAVIAKASAIHNPIIYAITHPKYRAAIARYIPVLRPILRVKEKDLRSSFSSGSVSSRRPTLTSQCSLGVSIGNAARANSRWGKTRLSSASDSDSCWTESEADGSSVNSLTFGRRVSTEISTDTAILSPGSSTNSSSGQNPEKTHKVVSAPVPSITFETYAADGESLSDGKALLLGGKERE